MKKTYKQQLAEAQANYRQLERQAMQEVARLKEDHDSEIRARNNQVKNLRELRNGDQECIDDLRNRNTQLITDQIKLLQRLLAVKAVAAGLANGVGDSIDSGRYVKLIKEM